MSWDTVKVGDRVTLILGESRNVGTVEEMTGSPSVRIAYTVHANLRWFFKYEGWSLEILPPPRPAWLDDPRCVMAYCEESSGVFLKYAPCVKESPHLYRPLWLLDGDVVPQGQS